MRRNCSKKTLAMALTTVLIAICIPSTALADTKLNDVVVGDSPQSEIEIPTEPTISNMIFPTIRNQQFTTDDIITTVNEAYIVNLTQGYVVCGANMNDTLDVSDIRKLLIAQSVIDNNTLDTTVTVKKSTLNKLSSNAKKFGLKEGDRITIKDLVSIYLVSDAEDVFFVLKDAAASNDMNYLSILNTTARNHSMADTSLSNIYGTTAKNQGTSMYDTYTLMSGLINNHWFMDTISSNKLTITYKDRNKKEVKKTIKNISTSQFDTTEMPDGYTLIAQFVTRKDTEKDSQFVIFKDQLENFYLFYFGNVYYRRDIISESGRFIQSLEGYEFTDTTELLAPTKAPTPTPTPTPKPTKAPTPTPTPTPTKVPTPTPAPQASKSGLPTGSNNERYQYILGTNYKAYTMSDRPAGYRSNEEAIKNMTTISVPVWKMQSNGQKYSSRMPLTIHKKLAESVKDIFDEIYALDMKFPIKVMVGYSYRKVGGVGLVNSTLMSAHTFGCAIDINYGDYDNDYFLGKGNDLRNKNNPYCIPDEVIKIFEDHGWNWGGNFSICSDTMHFQYLGLEFLTYQGKNNFRELKYVAGNAMNGADVKNLQQRLTKLGYKVNDSGNYYKTSRDAVKDFQKAYGLPVTGVVNYKTWETLINATHYMSYVF